MQIQISPGQELRDKFTKDPPVKQNHNDDQYMNKLLAMGVEANESLFPACFALKNGLQYPGMATKALIKRDEVLAKVPEKLILSSIKALKEPALKSIFQQLFYQDQSCWEDRILLTYCLYIYSIKAQQNIFYDMVRHLSKDIDILLFWPEQELNLFKDKTVKSAALIDQKSFEQEWTLFQQVQAKHKILQLPQFNRENYKWIFTHITSRCFGKAMDYTSFVPFCQFFNHHSSSVYYEINRPKKQQNEDQDDILSSNGSYESEEYLEEGEFAYDEIQRVMYKWAQNQCLDLDKNEKKKIAVIVGDLLERVQTEIDWKDFSVFFAGHFIERVHMMQSEYLQGRKTYEQTNKSLQIMKQILERYALLIKAFYAQKKGKKFQYKVRTRDNLQEKPKQKFVRPEATDYKAPYTQFYLKTDKNDRFDPNTQVFFCYGRNSNRSLLLHYGFAIEGNKYQHVWLSYELNENFKDMPDLLARIQKLGLPIRRKYRVNYTRLNLDLIIFFRLNSWNLYGLQSLDEIFYVMDINKEILILEQIKDSLESYLSIYKQSSQLDLTDKSLSYHQYFINVYHLEKKRILLRQIQLFEKLMEILRKLNEGTSMEEATNGLTFAQKYMFKDYLDTIVL